MSKPLQRQTIFANKSDLLVFSYYIASFDLSEKFFHIAALAPLTRGVDPFFG